ADRSFVGTVSGKDAVGKHLHEIYESNIDNNISTVYFDSYKLILPEVWPLTSKQKDGINLLNRNDSWGAGRNANISQSESDLKIMSGHALLTMSLKNVSGTPVLLSLNYVTNSSNSSTKYFAELVDAVDPNLKFWKYDLPATSGNVTNSLFIIPEDALDRNIKFRFGIASKPPGDHLLNIKSADLVFPVLS
ncbi:MAG TPA: hypothetical protein VJS91_03135, partial [Nitrososphaeraceae archaeon]|nr:hypothetical protein [Nitrososphaeraceae archaeon]